MSTQLRKKKKKISDLSIKKHHLDNKFNEFKKNSDFRKLIVKEKLFYKDQSDRVILYELEH